jgi:glycine oxidase
MQNNFQFCTLTAPLKIQAVESKSLIDGLRAASKARFVYNANVKSWDAIIIGGGIIGLSLAISLRKQGLRVLVVERGEPGQEASSAAAGMLVGSGFQMPWPLHALAKESARMYPEFVHELEDESGMRVELRDHGTILISRQGEFPGGAELLTPEQLKSLEPEVAAVPESGPRRAASTGISSAYLAERCLDPRALVAAAAKAAHHHGVDISSGTEVKAVLTSGDRATGVQTDKTTYAANVTVNCAGAWAGSIAPLRFPVRPIKGQMLAVVGGPKLKHVVRGDDAYLVPRGEGRIVVGSTIEDAGFNKQVEVDTLEHLFQAALELVPALAKSRKHEDWAGLRPATRDELPIIGETSTPSYFVASGHYRDGILLAPITAQLMTELILKKTISLDLTAFSCARFRAENL